MDDWVSQFISGVVGLITGLATGFYFERRQTNAARKDAGRLRDDNAKLESLVSQLRDQVKGVHTNLTTHLGAPRGTARAGNGETSRVDIADQVFDFIRRRIDATGAVERSVIFEHFYRQHGAEAVDAGILSLTEAGRITADQRTVRITS